MNRSTEEYKLTHINEHPRQKFQQLYHLPQHKSTSVPTWVAVKKTTNARTFPKNAK